MFKSVLKEIIIILLLILAIIILLGILFYDYMPSSKVVPEKVEEYAMDEDMKIELEQELNNVNSDEIVKTYQLDGSDIEVYEKTKKYNKGKPNPFEKYASNSGSGSNSNNNTGTSGSTSNNSSGVNNNSNNTNANNALSNTSEESYLNIVGK